MKQEKFNIKEFKEYYKGLKLTSKRLLEYLVTWQISIEILQTMNDFNNVSFDEETAPLIKEFNRIRTKAIKKHQEIIKQIEPIYVAIQVEKSRKKIDYLVLKKKPIEDYPIPFYSKYLHNEVKIYIDEFTMDDDITLRIETNLLINRVDENSSDLTELLDKLTDINSKIKTLTNKENTKK